MPRPQFVVATPFRTVCDDNARVLDRRGRLRLYAVGTRRGTEGIAPERTRLLPAWGAAAYAAARLLPPYWGEAARMALHPWFDRWVTKQLRPGDHIISSYGYANAAFRRVRERGGLTFLDGGNSHPENFWAILTEEHRRWKYPYPPVSHQHHRRSVEMMADVDYVLSPSGFVTRSFLERGFRPAQLLRNVYPLDLSQFSPDPAPRPADRPLTVISTGSLSLRKGTPYLLEAFRLLLKREPSARLMLTSVIASGLEPVFARYRDLPIDWSPGLPHPLLAERLRSADVFVLPSLEDGFARTVTEALACGLPAIVTPNTGAADLVQPGVNGSIVPIRDPEALAEAMLHWGEMMRAPSRRTRLVDPAAVSAEAFEAEFLAQLSAIPGLAE
ncbi:MAG TPA: glycosyltransferase family 4 protein [Chthoniobacteraceae bacterium]|jgi:glycosyltransferase involved in cell wall biosynthesis|nr:glycosyltransferase family 4 protein [Chthoniobacteraceae bacterium]